MTIDEMKALKVGDEVKDIKRSEAHDRKVICEVESKDEISVTIIALFAKDAAAYPHRFFFQRDAEALGLVEK